MEQSTQENVTNDNLKRIDQMVNLVKHDKEVSWNYMKIFEREEMLIQQGVEQGIERGIEQGKLEEQKNTEWELQRLKDRLLKLENKD